MRLRRTIIVVVALSLFLTLGACSSVIAGSRFTITGSLPVAQQGRPYVAQLQSQGGKPPYYWSASGLPLGLSIDNTGKISGTPQQSGIFKVVVTVTGSK